MPITVEALLKKRSLEKSRLDKTILSQKDLLQILYINVNGLDLPDDIKEKVIIIEQQKEDTKEETLF